jgi:predicted DNA-binding transcriptional regulator AlpA
MDGTEFEKNRQIPLMTSREVAQMLRISERKLWSMTMPRGTIPAVQIGRSVRYCPNVIQKWIASQMALPGSKA